MLIITLKECVYNDRAFTLIGSWCMLVIITDILYDSWSPAMTVSSICISILSMLSSSTVKVRLTIIWLSWRNSFMHMYVHLVLQNQALKTHFYLVCSNAQQTMTVMWRTARMGGHLRRLDGGSTMTKSRNSSRDFCTTSNTSSPTGVWWVVEIDMPFIPKQVVLGLWTKTSLKKKKSP